MFIGRVSYLRVIGVGNTVGNVQKHRDAIGVAGYTGLWEYLQQALPARRGQGSQLQDLQRMPGDLVAVPAELSDVRPKAWGLTV